MTVALDGTGDYSSLMAALGATRNGARTIVVEPGVYREVVRVWEDMPGVTIVGAGQDPADVVISYDLPAGGRNSTAARTGRRAVPPSPCSATT